MSRQREYAALTLILLMAAALRLWRLGDVPPGLSHDEVANWLIARDILHGNQAIYFTAAYGHEPLYQYLQAATVALFGDHWLGLRWPSVASGLLGMAATYTLIRYLFDVPVALWATAWLAVSFWPLFYARVAYRAILLPFTAALSAYFLFRVVRRTFQQRMGSPDRRSSDVLLAGLSLGLSVYTYMAARALPFLLAAVVGYAKIVRSHVSIPWSRVLLVFLIGALISAPLFLWLAAHPSAEYRVREVRQPLDRLLTGDPSLAWQNLVANLKFFTFAGDPWPRYNVPGRPVFAEPVGAALFVVGLLIALWRWREPRYGFLLIWLVGSLVPSVVTSDAPSSIRDILGLVATFAFPALGLVELERRARSQLSSLDLPNRRWLSVLPQVLAILVLVPSLFLTVRDYFVRWPQSEVVRFDYQSDLTAVAEWLEGLPAGTPVTVSGLSVHTMDGPTLELTSRWELSGLRLCDTRETLLVPSTRSGGAWLLIPHVVPFDEDLRKQLVNWGATENQRASFASYYLSDDAGLHRGLTQLETAVTLPDGTSVALPVSFGGRLAFLGYKQLDQTDPDDPLTLLTYWRVQDPPPAQLKIFAHLVAPSGGLTAQDDGLASPSDRWRADDVLIQKHVLTPLSGSSPPDVGTVRVGLYDNSSQNRLPVLAAGYLELLLEARRE